MALMAVYRIVYYLERTTLMTLTLPRYNHESVTIVTTLAQKDDGGYVQVLWEVRSSFVGSGNYGQGYTSSLKEPTLQGHHGTHHTQNQDHDDRH
jgi:hypothetical protein